MNLSFLLQAAACPYTVYPEGTDPGLISVSDITYDSRKAGAELAFVCLTGARTDGHDFASAAYEAGCRLFFAERPLSLPSDAVTVLFENTRAALPHLSRVLFGNPLENMTLIGITGTKGKTTTANLIGSALNACGIPCGVIGTVGISYPGYHAPTVNSTPESYVLYKTFRQMADAGIRHVVMEVSSQALFRYRVDGIRFQVAVFTNLSEDHVGEGEHPSFEHYKNSKKRLFSMCDYAVLNRDDPAFPEFAAACASPYVTYGFSEPKATPAFTVGDACLWREAASMGISFSVTERSPLGKSTTREASLRMPGRFNALNAAAAIAVLRHLGLSYDSILPSLAKATVPGRFETVTALPYCTTVIDYAHNGVSLESLLRAVRAYGPKRIICLYGSVGGRTKHRRKELAETSGDLADLCIITTDNPDDEPPEDVITDIASYYTEDMAPHICITDRAEAIRYALKTAEAGDVILLCGKGHETYQIVRGIHVPFSEKQVISDTVKEMEGIPHEVKQTI